MGKKRIEAGWNSYRRMVVPADASEVQVKECRQAFYAGAAILFENLMRLLTPGPEPMEADLERMKDIQAEITEFGQEIDRRYLRTGEPDGDDEVKFPATHVAHWPSGPVNCCEKHCQEIVGLGKFMGTHVAVTEAGPGASCTNCENEAKAEASG